MAKKERDPRVVAIAEKLVEVQPYGKDFRKTVPSVADYHAALIAVRTLDGMAEYEYALQMKDIFGNWRETSDPMLRGWSHPVIWADKESREELGEWCRKELGPDFRVVKRRKAGPVENA